MKIIAVLSLVVFLPLCASAQDIIVKKDGTIIKATVTKVSETEVEYKNFGSASERIYSLGAASIQSINYEDGTVEKFTTEAPAAEEKSSASDAVTKVAPDVEPNNEFIRRVNEASGAFLKQPKAKKTPFAVMKMSATPNSVFISEDLELHPIAVRTNVHKSMEIGITNRTNRMIYVDLGNTFLVCGESVQCYYTPGASSTQTSGMSGVGVNLGAVASAIGLCGPIGTLASGVNVGGGNTTSTSKIVYNKRVIAIPPKSSIYLERKRIDIIVFKDIMAGEILELEENALQSKINFHVRYSYSEEINKPKEMNFCLFCNTIYGIAKVDRLCNPNPKDFAISPDMIYFNTYAVDMSSSVDKGMIGTVFSVGSTK